MEPSRVRCILTVEHSETARRVGAGGLLIGRADDCDIVASDPSASRRHALVRIAGDGAEVVPLGRAPVAIDGKPTDKPAALRDGCVLAVPGMALRVTIELARPDRDARPGFVLMRGTTAFGITHTPFSVGGGATDDLVVKKWPAAVFALHTAQGALYVTAAKPGTTVGGEAIEPGELVEVRNAQAIECRGETFVLRAPEQAAATTAVGGGELLPRRVEIEMLPRGGRVVFAVGAREATVYLADRRLDLMMALLAPPAGHAAGEWIPDDVVRAVVWPRSAAVSRQEINTLIMRLRRDLVDAGLAGPRLVERAPGGGGTRVALAPGATVHVVR